MFVKASNHYFSAGIGILKDARFFCPFFVGKPVLSQLKQNQNKQNIETIFLQESGFCC